jgi:hypothetical protein
MPTSEDYEPVEFENVTVAQARDKALLCRIDGKNHWIPTSQIHDDSEVYEAGTEGTLIIPRWLAVKQGLV